MVLLVKTEVLLPEVMVVLAVAVPTMYREQLLQVVLELQDKARTVLLLLMQGLLTVLELVAVLVKLGKPEAVQLVV
jgi:hypothetical protein